MSPIGGGRTARLGAPAGPWSPASLPSLRAWWDFSDLATVTASGGAVSAVADKSGNGWTLVQANGTKKPTTGVDTVNSLPVLKFDGGDCLTCASFPIDGLTAYFVYKLSGAAGMLYEHGASSFTAPGSCLLGSTGGGSNVRRLNASNWDTLTNWAVDNAVHIVAQVSDGAFHASHDVIRDGTSIKGSVVTANDPVTSLTTATLNIGARNDASAFGITGDLCEIVWSSVADTPTSRGFMRAYAQTKWGTP